MKILVALLFIPFATLAEWKYNLDFTGEVSGGGTITFTAASGRCLDTGCPEGNWTINPTIDMMITSVITGQSYTDWSFHSIGLGDVSSEIIWNIEDDQLTKLVMNGGIGQGPYSQEYDTNWVMGIRGNLDDGLAFTEVEYEGDYDTWQPRIYGAMTAEYIPPAPLTVSFEGHGIWQLDNDDGWSFIHASSSDNMGSGDFDGDGETDLVISFGVNGIWIKWADGSWERIHALPADQIVIGDMDSNGEDDIIVSFEIYGIYQWSVLDGWVKIHSQPASGMSF